MKRAFGLDLGTTNSAVAAADDQRRVSLARFPHRGGVAENFRSILYFHQEAVDGRSRTTAVAGPAAIDGCLDAYGTGRLIQSLKSYLADRGFEATSVFGSSYSLVELLGFLVRAVRRASEEQLGPMGPRLVVGRPVRFAGADDEGADAFAEGRLRAAVAAAGFEEIVFEYEPVAAAYYYETRLDHDELVLIADFGGGTSDFSLLHVGPSARAQGRRRILGSDGVGVAGDALDAKILHHAVSPALGLGSSYRSMLGKELAAPVWIYAKLRRWHHLSFLKSKQTSALLREMRDQSFEPDKIAALIQIVEHDLGYHLYRSVERTKVALSQSDRARLVFDAEDVHIEHDLTRADFDRWVAEELDAMATCVDRLVASVGVMPRDVDRVFMTGGTSFVPAVRAIFDSRFGPEKVVAGGEMVSVASGLALRSLDP